MVNTKRSIQRKILEGYVTFGVLDQKEFEDEFDRGILKHTSSGLTRLNCEHPQLLEYLRQAFFLECICQYQTLSEKNVFYTGVSSSLLSWNKGVINVFMVLDSTDPDATHHAANVTTSLNYALGLMSLHETPSSIKTPRIHLLVQCANKPLQEFVSLGEFDMIAGSTAWFNHRDTLKGLLLEPKLAKCYTPPWTRAALLVLIEGTPTHQLEFRRLLRDEIIGMDLVKKEIPEYLPLLYLEHLLVSDTLWLEHLDLFQEKNQSALSIDLPAMDA